MPRNSKRSITIRTATTGDLPAITRLRKASATAPGVRRSIPLLQDRLLDRCLLAAEREGEIIAWAALDLEKGTLGELYFENVAVARVLFAKLVVRVEQLAVSFGMARLELVVTTANSTWFTRQGYAPARADVKRSRGRIGDQSFCLGRALLRRQTRFARQIRAMGEQLGIPADYGRRHRLALQTEARQLSSIGPDVFGREQFLAPRCAAAWFQMQAAANEAGVELQAVSAFRSVKYQQEIVQRKLDQGAPIEDILNVSAAPGYSEHHSGRALDITAPGFLPLEEEFENSAAFTWLKQNANLFGFRLSFPRRNRHGLAYEPWHWCRCEGV